ncbi:MAG TPA: cell division protein FtsA [Acidobacteriota bacterium]|nr:cell division protein FtsA [Acidobacteriota bacterium]
MAKKQLVAVIDIGTTKICSVIARAVGNKFEIMGMGQSPSNGLRRGNVVNLSETIASVKASLDEAEKQSETNVESAWVSVGGEFVRGINRRGETEIRGKHSEVSDEDVQRAVTAAKSIDLPTDYQIIHVLKQSFTVDTQKGIVDPIGMTGRNLGVNLHLVINAAAAVQNIVSAINKANVVVEGVVMQQLASAEAILTTDEKEMGTIVADIGGGTTDIAIYNEGCIWHSEVLAIGGNLVTRDIAVGLRAALEDAELTKIKFGSAVPEEVPREEVVEIHEVGSTSKRMIPRKVLCQIIAARCDQIVEGIAQAVESSGLDPQLFTGVVLTGGGAELRGMLEKVRRRLCLPARLGYPVNVVPLGHPMCKPIYCTVLGLLRYSSLQSDRFLPAGFGNKPKSRLNRLYRWALSKIS